MANATDHSSPSPSPSSVNQDPPPDTCARKPGGWRAVKYILGNESFEKLASMSLVGNLTMYLQSKYNIGGVFVVNIVSIWSGSSNIASLAGAFISDTYLGRFRTLLCGSIASLLVIIKPITRYCNVCTRNSCHTYIHVKSQGSVFSDMARVITAALRKRRLGIGPASQFYDPPLILSDQSHEKTKLKRTNRFKFLDKAAIITDPSELHSQENKPKNGWRLCSVQQVEELKCFIAIFPVWLSGVLCFIPMDQHNTFGVLQALQMDRSIGSNFKIPPAWLNLITMISLSIWIFIYEVIYIPLSIKLSKKEKRLSMQQRLKTGMVIKYVDLENSISCNSRNLSNSDSMDEEKGLERHGSN
ncbi:hypothetical protein Dsin_005973 [Dipteronia sinensis]|uniref:Uncharacterized protein n=1 Tax=Dipteronia sinensis TaxID=43782 RepID=A0AAE0AXL5_9ROSI|nr:hypothetical protein Dsin_005973 [Dipteronia sinensis]